MHETDFIQGLKRGDHDVFRQLIEQFQVPLVRLSKGFLHNEEDARDVVQETFIEVFESIERFRADASLFTWIYRIAVNKSLNLVRKRKISGWMMNMDSHSTDNSHTRDTEIMDKGSKMPGNRLEEKERSGIIRKAIDSLPVNQRIAFLLQNYHDLSYKEIAVVMEISLPSVESLIHRAKEGLQKRLYKMYKKNLL
ncbi:MAG TPA: RNA polymerase sigma factor [Bacteroidales bacterium]|nr:RNA polymerase sigma factor [Bacteroidales bacterium]